MSTDPPSLPPWLILLHCNKVTTTVSYSTGRYPFPFHRRNRSGGVPVVLEEPKLILFSCDETGSSQTSSSRPVIGPVRGEVASTSTTVRIVLFAWFRCWCPRVAISTEPFEDEIHPRLRFPHRGLVACANKGTKNSNDSQFFITLGSFAWFLHFLLSPNRL